MVADLGPQGKMGRRAFGARNGLSRQTKHDEECAIELFGCF